MKNKIDRYLEAIKVAQHQQPVLDIDKKRKALVLDDGQIEIGYERISIAQAQRLAVWIFSLFDAEK